MIYLIIKKFMEILGELADLERKIEAIGKTVMEKDKTIEAINKTVAEKDSIIADFFRFHPAYIELSYKVVDNLNLFHEQVLK